MQHADRTRGRSRCLKRGGPAGWRARRSGSPAPRRARRRAARRRAVARGGRRPAACDPPRGPSGGRTPPAASDRAEMPRRAQGGSEPSSPEGAGQSKRISVCSEIRGFGEGVHTSSGHLSASSSTSTRPCSSARTRGESSQTKRPSTIVGVCTRARRSQTKIDSGEGARGEERERPAGKRSSQNEEQPDCERSSQGDCYGGRKEAC